MKTRVLESDQERLEFFGKDFFYGTKSLYNCR